MISPSGLLARARKVFKTTGDEKDNTVLSTDNQDDKGESMTEQPESVDANPLPSITDSVNRPQKTVQTSMNELEFLKGYVETTRQAAIKGIAGLTRRHRRQVERQLDNWLTIKDRGHLKRSIEMHNPQFAETVETIIIDSRSGLPKAIADSQKPLIERQRQQPMPERLRRALLGRPDQPIDQIMDLVNDVRCAQSDYYRKLHESERRETLAQRQLEAAQKSKVA